jgi:hypothetical protein
LRITAQNITACNDDGRPSGPQPALAGMNKGQEWLLALAVVLLAVVLEAA